MEKSYTSFTVVNAVVALLEVGKKTKRELFDLLSNEFTRHEVDRAIETALNVKLIRKPALIKERYHEQTIYMKVL